MTRLRGEAFVFLALSAALASRAGQAPGQRGRAEGLADLLPPYAVSEEAKAAAETRLTSPPEGADHDPAPSPDGSWFVFASTRDSGRPQLCRRSIAGGPVRRLTSGPGARLQPAVSPGGAEIACAGEVDGSWDIIVLPSEGGREANLTATPDLDEIHPTWSPSGDALAFSRRDPADGVWWICAKRRGAGPATRICEGLCPDWSPAGDVIAFQRARGRGRGESTLWTVEVAETPDGGFAARGGATEIHSKPGRGAVGPAFGPRGEWIAFASIALPLHGFADAPRGGDLVLVGADGEGLRTVPAPHGASRSPAWAGGRIIVAGEDDAGRAGIWSVPAGVDVSE